MKEFLKNLDSTWSGIFFDEKSMKLQWENGLFGPKWLNLRSPKTAKNYQNQPKNGQKSVKNPRKAFKNATSQPGYVPWWVGDAWETVSERVGTPTTLIAIFKRGSPFLTILGHF